MPIELQFILLIYSFILLITANHLVHSIMTNLMILNSFLNFYISIFISFFMVQYFRLNIFNNPHNTKFVYF